MAKFRKQLPGIKVLNEPPILDDAPIPLALGSTVTGRPSGCARRGAAKTLTATSLGYIAGQMRWLPAEELMVQALQSAKTVSFSS
jgi:hypothetical protein